MTRDEFYARTRDYLADPARRLGVERIGEDDHLLALGLVDSLRMVELIAFAERVLGVEIRAEDHDPDVFYTLRSLYDAFGG
ncbi:acyl carrier protein [Actinomadura atramentaria]|uniref:acyl carrier protein n=1 Tax=Actinomadura atramentaria TaxID=1990 RepID=UPI00036DC8B0|nr:acyl carrier protein [Actinomadura atramentaria]